MLAVGLPADVEDRLDRPAPLGRSRSGATASATGASWFTPRMTPRAFWSCGLRIAGRPIEVSETASRTVMGGILIARQSE